MSYFKKYVNPSKRVGLDGVFLGLAGLLPGISLRLCPRKSLGAALPALGKPCLSLLFYFDYPSILPALL